MTVLIFKAFYETYRNCILRTVHSIKIPQQIMQVYSSHFRCSVDLSALKRDFTHDLWVSLEDGAGRLHLLVSVSGVSDIDPIHDLASISPRELEPDVEASMATKK